MDRIKIKEEAKKIIKNNLWNIWKPYLIILAVSIALSWIAVILFNIKADTIEGNIADLLITFITLPLSVGYLNFLLKFVRGKKTAINDVFSKMEIITTIFAVYIITVLAVTLGMVFLIVPGIIVGLMFSMTFYLLADGETGIRQTLTKSKNMMDGYKWDYFVFCLSFLGWVLLGIITLGIAYIYVIPYMNVANALYYENLKAKQLKKS